MTNEVIHGGGGWFTSEFEKYFQPLRRPSGVIGPENGPSDVSVVIKFLLISLTPRHGSDMAGRGFPISCGELAFRNLNRRVGVLVCLIEVHRLRGVVGVVNGLLGGV